MRRMLLSCHRRESLKTPLKTAIAPHVLILVCRHHVKVSEDDLGDEALLVFLQGYAKTSLKDDEYDLTFLGAEIEYQKNLKPFESVENSFDTEIRQDYVEFFDWLKECVVSNSRERKRDLNLQSLPLSSKSSKQTKGLNKKGQKRIKPVPSSTSFLAEKERDKRFKADKGKVMHQDASNVEVRII